MQITFNNNETKAGRGGGNLVGLRTFSSTFDKLDISFNYVVCDDDLFVRVDRVSL